MGFRHSKFSMHEHSILFILLMILLMLPGFFVRCFGRGFDTHRPATLHSLNPDRRNWISDRYSKSFGLDRRSLRNEQTGVHGGSNDERSSSGGSSLDEVIFKIKGYDIPQQEEENVEAKNKSKKKKSKKKKKAKSQQEIDSKSEIEHVKGTVTGAVRIEEGAGHQKQDENTDQTNLDNPKSPRRLEDYWGEIILWQSRLLESELWHQTLVAGYEDTPEERHGIHDAALARSILRCTEDGIPRVMFKPTEAGTQRHKDLMVRAKKFVKDASRAAELFKNGQMGDRSGATLQKFEELLKDGKRRLRQLKSGKVPPRPRSPVLGEPDHASSDCSFNSDMQDDFLKDQQEELNEAEMLLRQARARKEPELRLMELRREIMQIKDNMKRTKDRFPGQQGGSKTAASSKDQMQSELLEARRVLQEANKILQNARREKWLPEMLESLQENVRVARQRVDGLQKATRSKGNKKNQLDKRWLRAQ